jgi:hypothetical protein
MSRESLQKLCGLLEVGRVKAFGEPAIDRGQQLPGCLARALVLSQPTQAQRGPKLEHLMNARVSLGTLATRMQATARFGLPLWHRNVHKVP